MPALLVAHHRPGFYFRVLEEGEVEAGDEIVKVSGRSRAHDRRRDRCAALFARARQERAGAGAAHPGVERRLALFVRSLARTRTKRRSTAGNPALAPAAGPAPAWAGFRPLRVADKRRESSNVTSLVLEPSDGRPLAAAMPGQFIVLRLKPAPEAPALLRSYSLSGEPSEERWRISIKREPNGAAGAYVEDAAPGRRRHRRQRAARRFHARQGDGPVVLLSAGIGLTPVLAMLHALAAGGSRRDDLVDSWRPQRRRACVCRGSAGASQIVAPRPQPHPLQRARPRRPAGGRFRRRRALGCARPAGTRRASRGGFLSRADRPRS